MDRSNAAAALKGMLDGLVDARYFVDDKEIDIVVVDQMTWGRQDGGTQALYPYGCIVVDFVKGGTR